MINFLYRFCPFIIPMILMMIIYFRIDKNDKITKKIESIIPVSQRWKAFFSTCTAFIIIVVIGFLGIYLIDIPEPIYAVICGIIAGFDMGLSNKLTARNNK